MGWDSIQGGIAAAPMPTVSKMEVPAGILSQGGRMPDVNQPPDRIFLSELDVRPEVAKFALAMEEKLRENDWKGGWQDMNNGELLLRIR